MAMSKSLIVSYTELDVVSPNLLSTLGSSKILTNSKDIGKNLVLVSQSHPLYIFNLTLQIINLLFYNIPTTTTEFSSFSSRMKDLM
jgi:hypothetical protein